MTITINPVRNEFTATAAQAIFTYTFKIFASTDLNVYQTPAGQECLDSDLITAYTVTGVGDEDGGTITLNTPATLGDLITIVSDIPESRTTDYQQNGDFIPQTVNDDFDRVVSLAKQTEDTANRGLQFQQCLQDASALSLPAPVAGKFLAWKSDLSGMENTDVLSGTISVEDEGIVVVANPVALNFTGAGVTATNNGGTADIDIPAIDTHVPVEDEGTPTVANPTALNFIGTGVNVVNNGNTADITIGALISTDAQVGGNKITAHQSLVCSNPTVSTVDIDADAVTLRDTSNSSIRLDSINLTLTITVAGENGLDTGSEASDTWYHFFVIYNSAAISTGTTDSTTANKLEDSTADFVTDSVKIGDTVKNTTDGTTTHVTAVDDLNTLSVADDIFVSGESYEIHSTAGLFSLSPTAPTLPSGFTFFGLVGAVYNDFASNFVNFSQISNAVTTTSNSIISNGPSTATSPPATLDLSAAVPTTAKNVKLFVTVSNTGTPPSTGFIFGNNTTDFITLEVTNLGGVANEEAGFTGTALLITTQTIFYRVSVVNARLNVTVLGWEF